jgi:hypothetical protein
VPGEVEERIHKALQSHALERTADGYRLIQPQGAGISTLRLLPTKSTNEGSHLVSVAEITAEYNTANFPPFHIAGIQRLNSWAVHGAYQVINGRLRQAAQYSIYANETAAHLAAQCILNAFGGQLPLGRSTALAMKSNEELERQRKHHALPREWQKSLDPELLNATTKMLQQRGLAASNNLNSVWAELPLSGDCPSRAIDPLAETALLEVNMGVPHPIAGAGYRATISLPLRDRPVDAEEICARLNALELQERDFIPRLGAWGLFAPNDLPGYSCYVPSVEPLGELHATLMWWCVRRVVWLRDRFWTPNHGLTLDAVPRPY